jgi:hypothetical protein
MKDSRQKAAQNGAMTTVTDPFITGSVVAASLTAAVVDTFDPVLRRMLGGTQVFTKQPDGRWRPRGCQLGLARCFAFEDLEAPVPRATA